MSDVRLRDSDAKAFPEAWSARDESPAYAPDDDLDQQQLLRLVAWPSVGRPLFMLIQFSETRGQGHL